MWFLFFVVFSAGNPETITETGTVSLEDILGSEPDKTITETNTFSFEEIEKNLKEPVDYPITPDCMNNNDTLNIFDQYSSEDYEVLLERHIQNILNEFVSGNPRQNSFLAALRLIVEKKALVLVELGALRYARDFCGEGCSTLILANIAQVTGGKLYSVDNSEGVVNQARQTSKLYKDSVEVVLSESVQYLKNFDKGLIDFLYIDTLDPDRDLHLNEIEAAYDKLHKNTIVLIDDCNNGLSNNCLFVQQFLIERGWTLVFSDYQQIFRFR